MQIPLPPVDEKKKVIEDVDKDRRYAIDASIVRIMKSRKVLGHQQLVMECVEQLGRMFKVILFLEHLIFFYFILNPILLVWAEYIFAPLNCTLICSLFPLFFQLWQFGPPFWPIVVSTF